MALSPRQQGAITGGLRGLAASVRGVAEAKVLAQQAQTEEDRHKALMNLEARRIDLQERIAEMENRTEERRIETEAETAKAGFKSAETVEGIRTSGALDVTKQQGVNTTAAIAATGEQTRETSAQESQQRIAEIGEKGKVEELLAQIDQNTQLSVADKDLAKAAMMQASETARAEMLAETERRGQDTQKAIAEITAQLQSGEITTELTTVNGRVQLLAIDKQGKIVNQVDLGEDTKAVKPPTEGQSKAGSFARRIQEAISIMDSIEAEALPILTSRGIGATFRRNAPAGMGQSDAINQQRQAERNFINAVLRRESGAAIADSEFASAEKQYFPRPGDSEGTIENKRQARKTALNNMIAEAGPAFEQTFPLAPPPSGNNGTGSQTTLTDEAVQTRADAIRKQFPDATDEQIRKALLGIGATEQQVIAVTRKGQGTSANGNRSRNK